MFVIGATVVAIRNGRPATAVPSAQPAAPRSGVVPALQPAATSTVDATTHQVRRPIGAIVPVWRPRPDAPPRPTARYRRAHEGRWRPVGFGHACGRTGRRTRGGRLLRGVDRRDRATTRSSRSLLAAEHTNELELGTSIAVAFARNPMTARQHRLGPAGATRRAGSCSGLGSQIKPHITKRFSMEWSHPAAADARDDPGDPGDLGHVAERHPARSSAATSTRHTLMTPFFTPDAADLGDFGVPKIFLAGVGELMTEVAGEVCDGFLCHGFTTEKYLREVTIPALATRPRQGRQDDGGLRDRRAVVRRHRQRRRGDGEGGGRHPPADRVLRLDAGLPGRARHPRLGRPAGRAERAVEAGQVGRDGRARSTTRSSTRSPSSRHRRTSPPSSAAATAT